MYYVITPFADEVSVKGVDVIVSIDMIKVSNVTCVYVTVTDLPAATLYNVLLICNNNYFTLSF